ncbi:MAG: penicillin acylase family protein [Candidatus Aminicenantales bacterium]
MKSRIGQNFRRERSSSWPRLFFLLLIYSVVVYGSLPHPPRETIFLKELNRPVEIIRDHWGIPHLYASTEKDLFFAQGFSAARDRLFQLEIWRRRATGTLAEILGQRALAHDIGARLFRLRAPLEEEFNHYHPRGEEIISSFVKGINAYIELTQSRPEWLPIEFRLLGIKPGYWTKEAVISRHNGLFRNARDEIALARMGSRIGFNRLKDLLDLHPGEPKLQPATGLEPEAIPPDVLELYEAYRNPPEFVAEDLAKPAYLRNALFFGSGSFFIHPDSFGAENDALGSNNWVLSGKRTFSGYPILANDPHRQLQIPSLRSWVHLAGPGWNVIGGGEPALPGVSIGHNEQGAWGLTIFATDQEDIMVCELNPEDSNQYWYDGQWENLTIVQETIPIKGEVAVQVNLKFTRHGPVLKEDPTNRKVYALRAAWLNPGCAPYLASLRMDQAKSWPEFRDACSYSLAPSENMVWADRAGNIGWQVVGISPVRNGWNGLLPVPGDGRFEWRGFLPVQELPSLLNPPEGFIATANQDNVPPAYPYSLGFMWAEPYRHARIIEVLSAKSRMTLTKMAALQQDVLSVPARELVGLLKGVSSPNPEIQKAIGILRAWDFQLRPESAAAAIFISWKRRLAEAVWRRLIPEEIKGLFPYRTHKKMMDFLASSGDERDQLLLAALDRALEDLAKKFGPEMEQWKYGHEKFHHIQLRHPLSKSLGTQWREKWDLGPYPRGGDGNTVNNTSDADNQTSGASFRIIVDLGDWDQCLGTNNPGQSGNPDSPHYADLFVPWAKGEYFPVFFSRKKIESVAEEITVLKPHH